MDFFARALVVLTHPHNPDEEDSVADEDCSEIVVSLAIHMYTWSHLGGICTHMEPFRRHYLHHLVVWYLC